MKQILRTLINLYYFLVKVVYPLKQGLKPVSLSSRYSSAIIVKVVYPLKQGLKQFLIFIIFFTYIKVKVVYPLKQGLKLIPYLFFLYIPFES